MRQRIALTLHGWALQLCPHIALAIHQEVRRQTIAELAAQHHLTQAEQWQQHVAARAARQ